MSHTTTTPTPPQGDAVAESLHYSILAAAQRRNDFGGFPYVLVTADSLREFEDMYSKLYGLVAQTKSPFEVTEADHAAGRKLQAECEKDPNGVLLFYGVGAVALSVLSKSVGWRIEMSNHGCDVAVMSKDKMFVVQVGAARSTVSIRTLEGSEVRGVAGKQKIHELLRAALEPAAQTKEWLAIRAVFAQVKVSQKVRSKASRYRKMLEINTRFLDYFMDSTGALSNRQSRQNEPKLANSDHTLFFLVLSYAYALAIVLQDEAAAGKFARMGVKQAREPADDERKLYYLNCLGRHLIRVGKLHEAEETFIEAQQFVGRSCVTGKRQWLEGIASELAILYLENRGRMDPFHFKARALWDSLGLKDGEVAFGGFSRSLDDAGRLCFTLDRHPDAERLAKAKYLEEADTLMRSVSCNGCLKRGNFKLCAGCQRVSYCGRECQIADWKEGHKDVCKQLASEK